MPSSPPSPVARMPLSLCTSVTLPAGVTERIRAGPLSPRSVTSAVPSGRNARPHGMHRPPARVRTAEPGRRTSGASPASGGAAFGARVGVQFASVAAVSGAGVVLVVAAVEVGRGAAAGEPPSPPQPLSTAVRSTREAARKAKAPATGSLGASRLHGRRQARVGTVTADLLLGRWRAAVRRPLLPAL
jgi:hypothetical protein